VVAAAKSAGARGATLDLTNPPDAVAAAFRRAGFTPHAPFAADTASAL
jgi:phospholipid transport system transporter-binding protein